MRKVKEDEKDREKRKKERGEEKEKGKREEEKEKGETREEKGRRKRENKRRLFFFFNWQASISEEVGLTFSRRHSIRRF